MVLVRFDTAEKDCNQSCVKTDDESRGFVLLRGTRRLVVSGQNACNDARGTSRLIDFVPLRPAISLFGSY
jgi:hypothetical protein